MIKWTLCSILLNAVQATVLDSGKILVPVSGSAKLKCQNKTNGEFENVVWTSNAYTEMKETTLTYHVQGVERVSKHYANRVRRYDGTSFEILEARMNDTGTYECNIIYLYKPKGEESRARVSLLASYDVLVVSPPAIKQIEPERMLVRRGENASIYCDIWGLSPFNITWVKENGELATNTKVGEWMKTKDGIYKMRSHLGFTSFNDENAGSYICIANNIAGKASKKSTVLMKEPPVISAKTTILGNPGQTIVLWCNASGTHNIIFKWILLDRDRTLHDNEYFENFEVMTTEYKDNYAFSQLLIRKIEKRHWGGYRCSAENDAGSVFKDIILTGFSVPEAPSKLSATPSENVINLHWNLGHNGGRTIHAVLIEYKESLNLLWSEIELRERLSAYEITNLKPGTKYDFRVQTISKIGRSDYSEIFSVHTKEPASEKTADPPQPKLRILGLDVITFTGICGGTVLIITCMIVSACLYRQHKQLKKKSEKRKENERKEKEKLTIKNPKQDLEMHLMNLYS